jgi:uncharacterized membrane protein YeaQ/YmgE (transglycosylase-associated protein family)
VVSLIFGILWLGGVGSFVALVCGYVAKGRIAANPEKRSGHGIAVAGIVLGWIGAALALLLVVAFGVPLFAKGTPRCWGADSAVHCALGSGRGENHLCGLWRLQFGHT